MATERTLEMLARLRQLAPMIKPYPTEIVVCERDTAHVAEALVHRQGLLGERHRSQRLASEIARPAQVIERRRDGALIARLTEESLRFLEPSCRLRRRTLHVRHHAVRNEEPRARLRVSRGTGRGEHAIDAVPSLGEEPPDPEADERLAHSDGFVDVPAVER